MQRQVELEQWKLHLSLSLSLPHETTPHINPPAMEEEEEEDYKLPEPADWFTKLVSLLADLIYNCMVFLSSPIFSLLSTASDSYDRAEVATDSLAVAVHKVPSRITHGIALLLKKLLLGFVGAAYVCMVSIVVLVLAVVVGVGLVQLWVEEPVFMRERLYFDYTDAHPKAVFTFGGGGGGWFEGKLIGRRQVGVPIGHTFHVSLLLLMPESDFNREIGVFQVTAEVLSSIGDVIAISSQPCMLRYRSLPIRVTRTFILGVPLLLGISSETQKIFIEILKHKEGKPRTGAIRVTLIPRAGTSSPPHLYEAEIMINSQLPRTKELVRNWKWTFTVWTSLYIYIMFLLILIRCCKPLIFPVLAENLSDSHERDLRTEEPKEPQTMAGDDIDVSELVRKWQRRRSKRKAIHLHGELSETIASSASSISLTREETSTVSVEDFGDSESVCIGR